MGTMAAVITSVPTLLVASHAAAGRASNSLQTKELAMVCMTKIMHSLLVHGAHVCEVVLCKVHAWKDCINLATNNLGLNKKNTNNSCKNYHAASSIEKYFMSVQPL